MRVEIFTDGACSGNPGPGGWGAVIAHDGTRSSLAGGELASTNNRMEMMAVIRALEHITDPSSILLCSDSQYVVKGMTEWLSGWKIKGVLNPSHPKAVKNIDLWTRLEKAASKHQVHWMWVRGHAGHPGNEAADKLAVLARRAVEKRGCDISDLFLPGEGESVPAPAPF